MEVFSKIVVGIVLIAVIIILIVTYKKMKNLDGPEEENSKEKEKKNKTKDLTIKNNELGKTEDLRINNNELGETEPLGETEDNVHRHNKESKAKEYYYIFNIYNSDNTLYKSQDIIESKNNILTIGRRQDQDIIIANSNHITRDKHAILHFDSEQGRLVIVDQESTAGIYDSEHCRVKEIVVEDGVVFYIADVKCSIEFAESINNSKGNTRNTENIKKRNEFIGKIE